MLLLFLKSSCGNDSHQPNVVSLFRSFFALERIKQRRIKNVERESTLCLFFQEFDSTLCIFKFSISTTTIIIALFVYCFGISCFAAVGFCALYNFVADAMVAVGYPHWPGKFFFVASTKSLASINWIVSFAKLVFYWFLSASDFLSSRESRKMREKSY